MMNTVRIGFGYDVHRLVTGRALILGGVKIPHPYGLLGHSDADVITHALCDAILGAAALGDLGRHFPDSDPRYAGISSIKLLEEVVQKIASSGWKLGNADITLVAQAPKIVPFVTECSHRSPSPMPQPPGPTRSCSPLCRVCTSVRQPLLLQSRYGSLRSQVGIHRGIP